MIYITTHWLPDEGEWWVLSSNLLYIQGKRPQIWLCGPQSYSGYYSEEKNVQCPCQKSNSSLILYLLSYGDPTLYLLNGTSEKKYKNGCPKFRVCYALYL